MNMKRVFALLLAALLLCGCTNTATPETEPIPTEATVAETQAPTEAPTEAAAEVPTEPETTESETQPEDPEWLHSGIREDGSFDEGTLFIGDSLTYGMVLQYLTIYERLGDARFMAIVGAPVGNFFSLQTLRPCDDYSCAYTWEFHGMNFASAVETAGDSVTAVYYMMGTNYDPQITVESYVKIMNHILEKCPNATIYLQLVPVAQVDYIPYEEINEIIRGVHAYYQQQGQPRIMLIDTHTAIGDNLSDGIHLTLQGQENWYNAIVAFAEENNIPQ